MREGHRCHNLLAPIPAAVNHSPDPSDPTFRTKTVEDLFKTDASKMKENRSWKQTKCVL